MLKKVIPLFTLGLLLCSWMYMQGNILIEQLKSDNEQVRIKAKGKIMEERKELIDGFIEIVKEKREEKSYNKLNDRRLLAVQLLGELRVSEVVDLLVDDILFCPSQEANKKTIETVYPCVSSLIKIGKPATLSILKRAESEIKDGDKELRIRERTSIIYNYIIQRIEGDSIAKVILEKELEKEKVNKETTKIENLQEMLKHYEKK
ncbi:MAG: hypothetical protein A2W23_03935 [Planctomycetes bacterium RBG_16_43_13]|nr:MAG: hypothetical protein A2W23_03935 [Planctomycetes bacterium RBG_16_43_13]